MALYYNNNNVSPSNNVYHNSNASNKVYHNNNLVWQKNFQAFPGQAWQHYVNQNDAGVGYGAVSRTVNGVLELNGGYNGSSAQCALWVDFTPWKTLTISVNSGTCSYFQFRFGVTSGWDNIYGANEIKMWKKDGVSFNPVGTHTLDVSDISGSHNILIYLYSGSTVAANWINVNSVILS